MHFFNRTGTIVHIELQKNVFFCSCLYFTKCSKMNIFLFLKKLLSASEEKHKKSSDNPFPGCLFTSSRNKYKNEIIALYRKYSVFIFTVTFYCVKILMELLELHTLHILILYIYIMCVLKLPHILFFLFFSLFLFVS